MTVDTVIQIIIINSLILFAGVIGAMLISLRKLAKENRKFREENNFIGEKIF